MVPLFTIFVLIAAIALLARIAMRDLEVQKIANNDVLALALLGLANTVLFFLQAELASLAWLGPVIGLVLFLTLFPFWMMGKVGAGDIKLLSTIPLIVGVHYLPLFGILVLAFVAINVIMLRGTVLDGIALIQRYVAFFGGRGIIPLGVPISAAAIIVVLLQIFALPSPIG